MDNCNICYGEISYIIVQPLVCLFSVAPLSLSMQFARLGGRSFTAASHKISPAVILNQVKPKAGNVRDYTQIFWNYCKP